LKDSGSRGVISINFVLNNSIQMISYINNLHTYNFVDKFNLAHKAAMGALSIPKHTTASYHMWVGGRVDVNPVL
jgi:hypothetical protein